MFILFGMPSVRGMFLCRLDLHIFSRFQDINENVLIARCSRLWFMTSNNTFWRQNFYCDVNVNSFCIRYSRYAIWRHIFDWRQYMIISWINSIFWEHYTSSYIKLLNLIKLNNLTQEYVRTQTDIHTLEFHQVLPFLPV